MTIGFNLLYLIPGVVGGTETYARNLIAHIIATAPKNRYVLFVTSEAAESFNELHGRVDFVIAGSFAGSKWRRILYEQVVLPFVVARTGVDVLISLGYVLPVLSWCRHIVAVPDLLYKRFPNTLPRIKLQYWRVFIPLSVLRADLILAISSFTKAELGVFFPSAKEKVLVTPLAVDETKYSTGILSRAEVRARYALPESFLLCVATISPHKNLDVVLRAVARLHHQGIDLHLVLSGNKERASRTVEDAIARNGLEGFVHLIGYVPEEDLISLYAAAQLFILPSIYEGFGLLVLEAMACGCPVICSDAGSLPEVGGMAAAYFPPNRDDLLAERIREVIQDPARRKNMTIEGERNHRRFSWSETAQLTIEAVQKIASKA